MVCGTGSEGVRSGQGHGEGRHCTGVKEGMEGIRPGGGHGGQQGLCEGALALGFQICGPDALPALLAALKPNPCALGGERGWRQERGSCAAPACRAHSLQVGVFSLLRECAMAPQLRAPLPGSTSRHQISTLMLLRSAG